MGYADNPALGARRVLFHQRSGLQRVEGVFHVDGDAFGHNRLYGRGVDYLGAEVGQLLGGPVGDVGDGPGAWNHLGMGGHDAGDVGPDFNPAGVDADCHQGCGII